MAIATLKFQDQTVKLQIPLKIEVTIATVVSQTHVTEVVMSHQVVVNSQIVGSTTKKFQSQTILSIMKLNVHMTPFHKVTNDQTIPFKIVVNIHSITLKIVVNIHTIESIMS